MSRNPTCAVVLLKHTTVSSVTDIARADGTLAIMNGNYKDLKAWQKAMNLVLLVYRCTQGFPKQELYGLTSQMRRAAVSVASNIAEGKGRYSRKELSHFLYQARGSLLELETQSIIAVELEYLDESTGRELASASQEVGKILNGLINSFQTTEYAASI